MSTKKTTDTTNKYNSASMNSFNALQPGIQSNLQGFMGDPLKQPGFNLALQQGQNLINASGLRAKSQLLNNMTAGGFTGGTPGFALSGLNRISRANSAAGANNFITSYLQGRQQQLQATGMAQGYKPLQTGQTTTETTSGLGTWLPQVIGAGVGMAAGYATGGMSGMSGAAGKSGGSASSGMFSGALQSNASASSANPFLYSQPGQGGSNPFYGFGGNG